jgi:hypothetical protein
MNNLRREDMDIGFFIMDMHQIYGQCMGRISMDRMMGYRCMDIGI